MKLKTVGWARLTALVEEQGADGATELIVGRVANGEKLSDIGASMGIPYGVLYRWVQDDADRAAAYRAALEARADEEAHRILEIADCADAETVAVDKLRIDSRKWLAERWGKRQYGGEKENGGSGITVVVERGMKAEVHGLPGGGGVIRIGSDTDKGYPADVAPPIDGELVQGVGVQPEGLI